MIQDETDADNLTQEKILHCERVKQDRLILGKKKKC